MLITQFNSKMVGIYNIKYRSVIEQRNILWASAVHRQFHTLTDENSCMKRLQHGKIIFRFAIQTYKDEDII
jgi:hypothetical protein